MTAATAKQTEFCWVELTEAAGTLVAAGRLGLAADNWRLAFDTAQAFQEDDPRRASSHSNLAVAHRIQGEFDLAEQCCRRAMAGWQAAAHWVRRMHPPPRARSSLFHLRMERKHRQRFNQLAVQKFETLLPAGRAGTRNNLAELCQVANRLPQAQQLYSEALDERVRSIGDKDAGSAIIRRNISSLQSGSDSAPPPARESTDGEPFSSLALRRRWLIDQPAEYTDEGRLMAALLLTYVIDHAQLNQV